MVDINGKQYTSDYIVRAVAALEAAKIEDTGTDGSEVSLVMFVQIRIVGRIVPDKRPQAACVNGKRIGIPIPMRAFVLCLV
mgnify:CR=1 FL=1